jgi:hypothetical protein
MVNSKLEKSVWYTWAKLRHFEKRTLSLITMVWYIPTSWERFKFRMYFQKRYPQIWYTYMTLVTKYQIYAINSYWEKCDEKYLGRKVTEDTELTVNIFPHIFKYSLFPDFTKSQIFHGQFYFHHMMCEINVYAMYLYVYRYSQILCLIFLLSYSWLKLHNHFISNFLVIE